MSLDVAKCHPRFWFQTSNPCGNFLINLPFCKPFASPIFNFFKMFKCGIRFHSVVMKAIIELFQNLSLIVFFTQNNESRPWEALVKKLDLAVELGPCCSGDIGMTFLTFGFMVYLNYWNLPSTSILYILSLSLSWFLPRVALTLSRPRGSPLTSKIIWR